jgi:DNA-binding LacI/PurR family transcriptional regulator
MSISVLFVSTYFPLISCFFPRASQTKPWKRRLALSVTRIAEHAGVSIATVSRVLNNSRPVDPEIADRVRKSVAQLGMTKQLRRKNRMANREPVTTLTIAIVILGHSYRQWFKLPVIAEVVAELSRVAQEMNIGILMTEMLTPNELSPVLSRPEVRGALVFISSDTPFTTKDVSLLRARMPVVRVMGSQLAPTDIDHVTPDHTAVGYLASQYLLDHGMREFAYLTTRPTWDFSMQRSLGFLAGASKSGISPTVYLQETQAECAAVYGPNVVKEATLERLIDRMAQAKKGPFGLFVFCDSATVQVYPLLRARGLEPGRDVVVVSCDNESVRLSSLDPRPASIDLNSPEIAHLAVTRLARRISHRSEPPARILINPRLVTGEFLAD